MRDDADSGLDAAQERALGTAQREADRTGEPVQVDALTTETDTATANPGGTVSWTTAVTPQRVRRSGAWVPVDSTLARQNDGTYAPRAVPGDIDFSGGGSGPLVTMRNGKAELALSWPAPLPAPTASGSGITYPGVLPDVDLTLTANDRGGFTQVLVVKTAAAAADPALSRLRMTSRTKGVSLSDDGHDNFQAKAPDGTLVFSAPQPRMWDSAGTVSPMAAAVSGARSLLAAPSAGTAHTASVDAQAGSGAITLTPDPALLTAADTHYPLYIDPSWNPHTASGARQHFIEVQSGCPTAKNYDSTQYGDPGVGYNGWSGCVGIERSYFQLAIPSSVWGTHVVSAVVNVMETSSSSCAESSGVSLRSAHAFSGSTTWNSRPGLISNLGSQTFGPACSSHPSKGYSVTSTIAKAAAAKQGSWTFALLNNSESDRVLFKRFAANPSMTITYNHVPNTPSALAATVNSSSYGCDVTAPYPLIGKTVATTPPALTSTVSDADKDALAATYSYWVDGTSTKKTLTSANVSSGQKAPVRLPASFITGLKDGSTVDWQVSTTDGKDTRSNSSVCHFTVDQRAPVMPVIKSDGGLFPEETPGAAAGTAGTFTASVAPGSTNNTASKFVFGLDVKPPTSNPPASQVKTAVNNSASYAVTPSAPGTHILWAYALDAAGNASEMAAYEFIAQGHAPRTYATLKDAFNNTAISADTNPGAANADGLGQSFSAQDLAAAGWKPGEKITVNGADFTLPAFGAGAADNVLAANQTIRLDGAAGDALVFLATSTGARTAADRNAADTSSPVIQDGTPVAGTNCSLANGTPTDCEAATGAVNYTGETAAEPYFLSAPDWSTGPNGLATVTLPHTNKAGAQTSSPLRIYTFAIPLRHGSTVDSVTLPDISDKAVTGIPGLHIFAMAVRDTAAAPAGAAAGAAWKGAWSAPVEGSYNYNNGVDYRDQTIRTLIYPTAAGTGARFRLSNERGVSPLVIDHVTFALQTSGNGAKPDGPPVDLTFEGGKRGITVPVGGTAVTDVITTPIAVRKSVLLSFHLANAVTYLPQHSWASSYSLIYVAPVGSGDHTADTDAGVFTGDDAIVGQFTNVVTGMDVLAPDGQPTVAVVGDGLVAPGTAGSEAKGVMPRFAEWIWDRLQRNSTTAGIGVVGTPIKDNRLALDRNQGGASLFSRIDRDVLAIPGLKTVVIVQGIQDIAGGADDATVTSAYTTLRDMLRARGIKTVFATLTPCVGYAPCTTAADANRVNVNGWISEQQDFTAPYVDTVDMEAALAVPDATSTLDPPPLLLGNGAAPADFDAGDHVNLTRNGYGAAAAAVEPSVLVPDTLPGG
ncbi:hypothetical protein ACGFZA_38975 [Streptomyces sp. NPDC048211]|uniref:hypothetical protein n=1 Tax=Streptomyces sp. NPDC048211 TaxID=3365516 RepID=UPI00371A760B